MPTADRKPGPDTDPDTNSSTDEETDPVETKFRARLAHLVPPGSHPLVLRHLEVVADDITAIGIPAPMFGPDKPDRFATVAELQTWSYLESIPLKVRDAVWTHLILQARRRIRDRRRLRPVAADDADQWYLLALGAAMRRLRFQAWLIAPTGSPASWITGAQYHLAAEFVYSIARIRLDRPNIAKRVAWNAAKAARTAMYGTPPGKSPVLVYDLDRAEQVRPEALAARRPTTTELYRLLSAYVTATKDIVPSRTEHRPHLSKADAELIARTSLDGETIEEAAAAIGISPAAARGRLPRAKRIVEAIMRQQHETEADDDRRAAA